MVAWIHDPGSSVGVSVLALVAAGLGTAWIVLDSAWPAPSRRRLLVIALLLRAAMFTCEPSLTSDVWRYLWEGRVVAAGVNPYLHAPESEAVSGLRNEVWERVHHRDVATVYPPAALGLFSIVARLPASLWWWKGIVGVADLLVCALLTVVAFGAGIDPRRVAWYAWNPVVAFETAGMGHLDGVAIAAVVAAVVYLRSESPRPIRAGLAAAMGVAIKLGPLVALPMWARASRRPAVFLVAVAVVLAVVVGPVLMSVGGVPPGMTAYAVRWDFNGPLFEPIWRALEGAEVSSAVKCGLDLVKSRIGHDESLNRLYPLVYPQLLAKMMLAPLVLLVVAGSVRRRDPIAGTGELFGRLTLLSATVFPWYLLWAFPFAALCGRRSWLWLVGVVPITYLPSVYSVAHWPWIHLIVWGPFLVLAGVDGRWNTD